MPNHEIRNVLLLVDANPDLTVAAQMALVPGGSSPKPVIPPGLPRGFHYDSSFPPVPISEQGLLQVTMSAAAGRAEGGLVVRGQVRTSELEEVFSRSQERLFSDPYIEAMPTTCAGNPPIGTAVDVARLLDTARLHGGGMDGNGVAIAIVDGGVNLAHLKAAPRNLKPNFNSVYSWSASPRVTPGSAPVGHGTMCAYDALIAAPQATLLDIVTLVRMVAPGGPALAGLLSDAIRAFSQLMAMMIVPPGGGGRPFHSLVVSNSWGVYDPTWDFPVGHGNRYIDNPGHAFNRVVSALASTGADIVFAAGNCGPICPDGRCAGWVSGAPVITGANSHPETLCAGGVDINRAVVGYSSHGPGSLTHDKPDLASYTHFLGSEAYGSGQPDGGTSAACPVLAGAVAALRSIYPHDAANANRHTAKVCGWIKNNCGVNPSGALGWTPDLGFGIIDTVAFAPGIAIIT